MVIRSMNSLEIYAYFLRIVIRQKFYAQKNVMCQAGSQNHPTSHLFQMIDC